MARCTRARCAAEVGPAAGRGGATVLATGPALGVAALVAADFDVIVFLTLALGASLSVGANVAVAAPPLTSSGEVRTKATLAEVLVGRRAALDARLPCDIFLGI